LVLQHPQPLMQYSQQPSMYHQQPSMYNSQEHMNVHGIYMPMQYPGMRV
jgi:hypothetical protein